MCVAVNDARYEPLTFKVGNSDARRGNIVRIIHKAEYPAAADQDVLDAEIIGRKQVRVGKQLKHDFGHEKGAYCTLRRRLLETEIKMKATLPSSPLGKESASPDRYDSRLLFAIPRAESRILLGIEGALPFSGSDLWNVWELTWLTKNGRPEVAHCEIRVPAETPNIIESKSLKLYLNSYAMSRYATAAAVQATLKADLAKCAGGEVRVTVHQQPSAARAIVSQLPGQCIDASPVTCDRFERDPGLLVTDPGQCISEALHSHLLRSLCPVTRQPDTGSLLVQYKGPRIEPGSLLRYLVSFRKHRDFHEACVERIFVDLMQHCGCESLTVYARYQRRGGIDINPFRSTSGETAENLRLWRQ